MIDHELVRTLRAQVADRLNDQRRRDQMNGVAPMGPDDEREYSRSLIIQILEDYARLEIADGVTIKVARGAVGRKVDPTTAQLDGTVGPEEN